MPAGKQLGTYHVKVVPFSDKKKLVDGSIKKYKYGRVIVSTPDLAEKIGDKVMIRVFEEEDKPKKVKL